MADFILQGVRQTRTQALDLSKKIFAFLVPLKEPFPKTLEHPWTKQYLAGEAGEKMFNPTLMNKLIRIE